MDFLERFCNFLPPDLPEDNCWLWRGAKDKNGYGMITRNGSTVKAHRVSYEVHWGESLETYHCLHRCDNPSCVNPNHLFSGTNLDNVQDKVKKGRCYTGDQKGEKNGNSKLTDAIVKSIRTEYNSNSGVITHTALAKKYGVSRPTISYIVNNKTHIT